MIDFLKLFLRAVETNLSSVRDVVVRGRACIVAPHRKPRAVWLCGRVIRSDRGSWFVVVYRIGVFLQSFRSYPRFRCLVPAA